jgi:hypothetical protein
LTRPWVDTIPLSPGAQATLPAASLSIDLTPVGGPPPAKHIRVALRWAGPGGQMGKPVQVVAWKYEPTSRSP